MKHTPSAELRGLGYSTLAIVHAMEQIVVEARRAMLERRSAGYNECSEEEIEHEARLIANRCRNLIANAISETLNPPQATVPVIDRNEQPTKRLTPISGTRATALLADESTGTR